MPVNSNEECLIFPKLEILIFLPKLNNPLKIISKLTDTAANLINNVSTIFTTFETTQITEYIEQSQNIQKQMLDIFLPSQEERYSRLNLRLLLGLSPGYEKDPGAIRTLEGTIAGITKEKINVTKIIRKLRGTE